MRLVVTAGGLIIKDKKILLLKRSSKAKMYPNCWGVPGGKINDESEPLKDVAKREIKEEIGIDFEPTEYFLWGELFVGDFHVIGPNFLGKWSGEVKLDSNEHSEYGWFTYEDAMKLRLSFQFEDTLESLRKRKLL